MTLAMPVDHAINLPLDLALMLGLAVLGTVGAWVLSRVTDK